VVVTKDGTEALVKAGVDSIRIGIGPGSHCTTRLVTGVGRPQLSSIQECYKVAKKYKIPLIAESGIKHPGDIPKALVFGASAVMIGGLFAGTDECPGSTVRIQGKTYKYSWGMCTDNALRHNTPKLLAVSNLLNRTRRLTKKEADVDNKLFEEGVEGLVPYKGGVGPVIKKLIEGTRRSMWYQGARNISNLRKKARVVLVSSNTATENIPRI